MSLAVAMMLSIVAAAPDGGNAGLLGAMPFHVRDPRREPIEIADESAIEVYPIFEEVVRLPGLFGWEGSCAGIATLQLIGDSRLSVHGIRPGTCDLQLQRKVGAIHLQIRVIDPPFAIPPRMVPETRAAWVSSEGAISEEADPPPHTRLELEVGQKVCVTVPGARSVSSNRGLVEQQILGGGQIEITAVREGRSGTIAIFTNSGALVTYGISVHQPEAGGTRTAPIREQRIR